jgi:hypothetical protein
MTIFELIVISIIFLEEFIKRSLIGIYYLYMKFDYWNFNRNLDKRNQELYEKTPKPNHD